jgi:transcriptional regulator with XRE-family HTH domain
VPGLRAARLQALLTQAQLGRRANLAPATIVRLEKGERPAQLATVAKLAAALGVEPRELTEPPAG